MFTEDPTVFLRDFGRPCSANGWPFKALLSQPDEVMPIAGMNVISTGWLLRALATDVAAAGLATGVAMVVDGVPATVRDVLSVDDGVFSHITFSR